MELSLLKDQLTPITLLICCHSEIPTVKVDPEPIHGKDPAIWLTS